MINIDNLTINIHKDVFSNKHGLEPVIVRYELVHMLRIISEDVRFREQQLLIPEDCEQYGFATGNYDLPKLLHFLADMLE